MAEKVKCFEPDKCDHCGADILWIPTARRRVRIPVNPGAINLIDLQGRFVTGYTPHDLTCKARVGSTYSKHLSSRG